MKLISEWASVCLAQRSTEYISGRRMEGGKGRRDGQGRESVRRYRDILLPERSKHKEKKKSKLKSG